MPALVQRVAALIAIVVLSPALAMIAIAVRTGSPGPAIHRATRISRGRPFTLLKFRTMAVTARDDAAAVTAAGDARVTHFGGALRRSKLDELPQLWNVIRGEMLLVGPRPEDPRFIDWSNPIHQEVFRATPGITGPAAIAYRSEERALAEEATALARSMGRDQFGPDDIDRAYLDRLLPRKLALDVEYLRRRSARGDLAIIGRTLLAVAGRAGAPPS